ncbi:MAG: UDP-glucuronic acid decarboxylase family protein [Gammaproteobacteria bacterium]|nr:UDP-glucuronic acid decarboxylase family protein [Gammaproteobacteria bacterium]
MSKKRILVTGGAGFLGTNLTARLLDEGHHVICIDNFLSGLKEHITGFLDNPNYQLIEHDIIDPIDLEVDEIYNLACAGSPPHYQANPIHTTKTCVHGILNMLELAKKNNARIMQASTSEVYGDPEVHPQVESYLGNVNPNGIRSCYDEGKRCAESLCFDHQRMYGTNIKIARIFNTYGPHMDPNDGRVVSNFIVQSLRGEPLTVYGDGSQTRSFCYVDDLIEGFIRLMASEDFTGPVNLGNPVEFTVKELAEKTLQMINPEAQVTYLPLPADDPTKRKPDITLARTKLGWEPSIALNDGLIKTIAYFKSIV